MAKLDDLTAKLTDLTADVTELTAVEAAVETLINGLLALITDLKQQIAELLASGASPAQIASLLDSATASEAAVKDAKDKLAAAVVSGTPIA